MTEFDKDALKPGPMGRLRAYFLTGLVIAGPLAATAYITWWVVNTVDGWVKPWIPDRYLPDSYVTFNIPGIGLIFALFGLTLLGFLAANLAGRTLLTLGERLLDRTPVVRGLYRSLKQVFETMFSQSGSSFRRVGLVEFPVKGCWSIVFISSPPTAALAGKLPNGQQEMTSVFLPCSPNPTTGFWFILPSRDVIEIPMAPDAAVKLIMSAGLIQAEMQEQLAAIAVAAREGEPPRPMDRAAG